LVFIFLSPDIEVPIELKRMINESNNDIKYISWRKIISKFINERKLGKISLAKEEFLGFVDYMKLGVTREMTKQDRETFIKYYQLINDNSDAFTSFMNSKIDTEIELYISDGTRYKAKKYDDDSNNLPTIYRAFSILDNKSKSICYVFGDIINQRIGAVYSCYQVDEQRKIKFRRQWENGLRKKVLENKLINIFTWKNEMFEQNKRETINVRDPTSDLKEYRDYLYLGTSIEYTEDKSKLVKLRNAFINILDTIILDK
jgi:hypothetical protein